MRKSNYINQSKRQFLRTGAASIAAGAIGTSGFFLPKTATASLPKIRSSAKIVIAGAGAAGLTIASQLAARLEPSAQIILIDSRIAHYYQPGFTLVAAGIKPKHYVVSQTEEYLPDNVKWIKAAVNEFDPDSNRLTTSTGEHITYDYLFVATEMKCAGAPLKYTFIVRDYLLRRHTLDKSRLFYNAHNKTLFSVPIVDAKVKMLFAEKISKSITIVALQQLI